MTIRHSRETYSTSPSSAEPGNLGQRSADYDEARLRAKWWKQQQKAGERAKDAFTAFTKSVQFEPDGLISQRWPNVQDQFETCGKHLTKAAASTTHDDFAKHYSAAYQNLNQIQIEQSKSASLRESIHSHLDSLVGCVADLSRAAYIRQQNDAKAASKFSEARLHEYWIRVGEMRTDYERAMEEYSARFTIDKQTQASPTAPSVNGPQTAATSIGLGDNDTIPPRRAFEERAESDLEHVFDTIRKLVPGADNKTNKELKEHLFAVYTAGSEGADRTIDPEQPSRAAEPVEESIFKKYQVYASDLLAVDVASPTAEEYAHRQAAFDTLPVLDKIQTWIAQRYNRLDLVESDDREEFQGDVETVIGTCRRSVQNIAATDNFFRLSRNFCDLDDAHGALDIILAGLIFRRPSEGQEYERLGSELTDCQIKLSEAALSTVHPGEVDPEVFESRLKSRYYWLDGRGILDNINSQVKTGNSSMKGTAREEAKARDAKQRAEYREWEAMAKKYGVQ